MEPFADIVRAMHITAGIFLDAEFTAPWCVSTRFGPEDCGHLANAPRSVIGFHYVSAGRMLLSGADGVQVAADQGDILVLPGNDVHLLGSTLDMPPVVAESLIQPGADGRLARICHGGGGDATHIVCGFLGTDRANDPVLSLLPDVLTLKVTDAAMASWFDSSFRLAAAATLVGPGVSPEMLPRLAGILFAEAIRRALANLPAGKSRWRNGLADPKLAEALGLLHGNLQKEWTTDELAQTIGMSRSSFAERFSRVIGASPIRYFTELRLTTAARRLAESDESLARVAFDVGYESEAAFNRAFKREFGKPPATWRKNQPRNRVDPSLGSGSVVVDGNDR